MTANPANIIRSRNFDDAYGKVGETLPGVLGWNNGLLVASAG